MKLVLVLVVSLAGCATGRTELCGSDWHCEQVLMRKGDYRVSSSNPYPRGPTRIQELKNNHPTGRTYEVKR